MTKQERIEKMVRQHSEQMHAESLCRFYAEVKKAMKKTEIKKRGRK